MCIRDRFQYEAEGPAVDALEVEFRRDEKVMRYLTVKLDIHAHAWAEKRKNRKEPKVKA